MLDTLRNSANSWVAKFLLGLVAVSFVYWGADSRSSRSGVGSLATVGSATITQNDFQRAYENELAQLSQRAGRRITNDEARAYGVDRRVMSRLVGTAALDNQVSSLGLALSDETVAENLRNDPNFKGLDGKFDRSGFENFLRSIGMSERAFLDQKRKEDERAQLTGTLISAIVTPKPIIAAVHAWKDETRVAEYLTIDADKAVAVADPDAAKLKETYESNKAQFMAPEYRKLQILLLSVDELKSQMTISDADVAASYEQTKDNYATPEVRRIQQIPFKDKAAAEAAKTAIAGGKNFMKVAEDAMALKDFAQAHDILSQILGADPANVAALANLVVCLVGLGELERASAALTSIPPDKLNNPAVKSAAAALDVALHPVETSVVDQLQSDVDKSPDDFQKRLELAVALNGAGMRAQATDHLLYIFKKQRTWNDDAARKQLVTFFEGWGPKDEFTLAGRRKLSALLFS